MTFDIGCAGPDLGQAQKYGSLKPFLWYSCYFSAVFVLSYVGLFVSRSISASHILHQKMVHSIVRSPMSFFDLTPIGRIINRFSADIDTVDNVLPLTVEMWLDCVFAVVATLIVICYSTPIFLVTILPLAVVYFFVQVCITYMFK